MSDPIAEILALFAVARPQSRDWLTKTEHALRRAGFLLHLTRNITKVAFDLCNAGHPFVVTIGDDMSVNVALRGMSASVSVEAPHGLTAMVEYKGFPSVVVPSHEQIAQEPLGFDDGALRMNADRVTLDVMRRFHAAMA